MIACRNHVVNHTFQGTQTVVEQRNATATGTPSNSGESFVVVDLAIGKHCCDAAL